MTWTSASRGSNGCVVRWSETSRGCSAPLRPTSASRRSRPSAPRYPASVGDRLPHPHARGWSRRRRRNAAVVARWSSIRPEPFGVVLVISPWNYPLQLVLVPPVGALAAGNCVVIKPSEVARAPRRALAELVPRLLSSRGRRGRRGRRPGDHRRCSAERFDYIFYTGNGTVGRHCDGGGRPQHLTPVTLELGGKSPCIVDASTPTSTSRRAASPGASSSTPARPASRPTTCSSTRASRRAALQRHSSSAMRALLRGRPRRQPRLRAHRQRAPPAPARGPPRRRARWLIGGRRRRSGRYLAPTVVRAVASRLPRSWPTRSSAPFCRCSSTRTSPRRCATLRRCPKPLTAYLFSRTPPRNAACSIVPAGAVVLNDTLLHFTNPSLPFGGVGASGMGSYHGRRTFSTFTHEKAVLSHRGWPRLLGVRWPPYRLPLWMVRSLRWFG